MKNFNNDYAHRLARVIPGGAHTYSRGSDQFPSNAPAILNRGKGAYVFDHESNGYLDYGMGLRSVTIGYADERINSAVVQAINNGNSLTRPSTLELEAAELFVELIHSADMVKFAKNGSNATTAAVKLARAHTKRKYVCVPKQHPFYSFDDWFIGTTAMKRGTLDENSKYTLLFDFEKPETLKSLFKQYPNQIAAVMLEPTTHITPCSKRCSVNELSVGGCKSCPNNDRNVLKFLREICDQNDCLLIFDETITGFRWDIHGAENYFGVTPDLSTFGKGMANGFSVAAVSGRREVMELGSIDKPNQERVFLLSSTHGAEMSGLAAFVKTMEIYQQENIIEQLWASGQKFKELFNQALEAYSLNHVLQLEGAPVSISLKFFNGDWGTQNETKTLFLQEMMKNKVMMPWVSISAAHQIEELFLTADALDNTFKILRKAVKGSISEYLEGDEVRPVFRKFN